MKRPPTKQEQEVFKYLHKLRESNKINMLEAAPCVIARFNVSKKEARILLHIWMINFNSKGVYEEIEGDEEEGDF